MTTTELEPESTIKPEIALKKVCIDDKYCLDGQVFMSGTQALCRLPMLQKELDREAGLNTAGYISGYRGSPLGNYDQQLLRMPALLAEHDIVFQPGVNEELAATAVWGSQQVGLRDESDYDGVFGIWYGKGPGVDRTGDAFRHANLAGSARYGGVLALLGDDHTCESSTTCHQSEFTLVDAMMPILNPAGVQEILDYGLYGFALSRYSGCWVGIKCVHDTVSVTASVNVDTARIDIALPEEAERPVQGLNIRVGDTPREQELRLHEHKLKAAQAFAYSNHLDRVLWDAESAKIGIVSTGKSYLDVCQALADLGIDEAKARQLGVRLYKVAMPWPLEPRRAREACAGLDLVIVVEEKRSLIEPQLKELLYATPNAPVIVGKRDQDDRELLRAPLDLDSNTVAIALAEQILRASPDAAVAAKLAAIVAVTAEPVAEAPVTRKPYFCAGCPHNTSTKVPDGSRGMAGIGCAWMSQAMGRNVDGYTQMGGEGASWVGEAPFSNTGHIFQNLGDGTYFHSGLLAIRAAIAAGTNITYKILYNDAVAMTGGQPHDGELTPWQISRQVHAEGAKAIVVVTDEPKKYPAAITWAPGVSIHHRRELDSVQARLRNIPGTTVLIYDQTCAAEKRRRRKRNLYPDPAKRLFINEQVCEGCGDCSIASNCVAIVPKETVLGVKRAIDQSACNKDYACNNGFCPSFVTVQGGQLRKEARGFDETLIPPEPVLPALGEGYAVVVTGIGGTGVVTIGALLGMAAHLEDKGCAILDMTGMAQKGGAVMTHLRLAERPADIGTVRIAPGGAQLILGCDMVVTGSEETLGAACAGVTRALVNTQETMTGDFTRDADFRLPMASLKARITDKLGSEQVEFIEATQIGVKYLGDSITSNLMMLGYAYQKALLPLSAAAINRAIELNGAAVAMNQKAFLLGRQLAAGMLVEDEATPAEPVKLLHSPASELQALVEHCRRFLIEYQNRAYAERYCELVERVKKAERALGDDLQLTLAVARYYFKLLAYKDEYEVARLHSNQAFINSLKARFEGDYKLRFNLAPPLLSRKDPRTGELVKREFGGWMLPVFKVLSRLKGLRGGAFDPFGYQRERVEERQMIVDYEQTVARVLSELNRGNYAVAEALLSLPERIRGFGHVKDRHIKEAKECQADLEAQFLDADRYIKVA